MVVMRCQDTMLGVSGAGQEGEGAEEEEEEEEE